MSRTSVRVARRRKAKSIAIRLLRGQSGHFLRSKSQNRLQQPSRQVPDGGDETPIAGDVIGVIVAFGQSISVVEAHETGGLSRRKQPRPHLVAMNDDYRLPARAAPRSSEAARNFIEPN